MLRPRSRTVACRAHSRHANVAVTMQAYENASAKSTREAQRRLGSRWDERPPFRQCLATVRRVSPVTRPIARATSHTRKTFATAAAPNAKAYGGTVTQPGTRTVNPPAGGHRHQDHDGIHK